MKRIIGFAIAIMLLVVPMALAQNTATKVVGIGTAATPAGGTVSVDCVSGCGGSAGTPTNVVGNVGGYEFNASVIPTVQNASYTAGQSLGGLQTISIGSTASLSGILTGISVESNGGSLTGIVAYVWSKNPASTTCTDNTNFVVSQTDNKALVNNAPTLIIPAIIVSGQDTHTYAASTNLVGNFVNGSANTDLYVCLLTNATVTPATTTDIRLNIQGTKDAP